MDTEDDLKPDKRAWLAPEKASYQSSKPHLLERDYKTYEEFKDAFINKRARFGKRWFLDSNHYKYWKYVIGETDRCTK